MIHRFVDLLAAGIIPYQYAPQDEIWQIPPGGGTAVKVTEPGTSSDALPDPTQDSALILFVHRDFASGNRTLRQVAPDGTGETTIMSPLLSTHFPTWTRDAAKILFRYGLVSGIHSVATVNADGTGFDEPFTSSGGAVGSANPRVSCAVWSPDGSEIVFGASGTGTGKGLRKMNADGTGLTVLNTRSVAQVNWGWQSDFLVYHADTQVYISDTDGTGETVLTTFGANALGASRRLLAHDDSAVYMSYQTAGSGSPAPKGRWEIYRVPLDASGQDALDIWTTGNTSDASGFAHNYPADLTRFYVCAYPSSTGTPNAFVSYLLDGTGRVEHEADGFDVSLGDTAV